MLGLISSGHEQNRKWSIFRSHLLMSSRTFSVLTSASTTPFTNITLRGFSQLGNGWVGHYKAGWRFRPRPTASSGCVRLTIISSIPQVRRDVLEGGLFRGSVLTVQQHGSGENDRAVVG